MANIVEIRGNIFNSACQTIVNPVNCVGVMGRGIALEFKYRFPVMYKNYQTICRKNLLKPGLLFLHTKSKPWILNFPTKNHWRNSSKIEYIEMGLIKLSKTYKSKNIVSIAFPELGTNLGKLDWEKQVKPLMSGILKPLDNLEIEIYHFDASTQDQLFQVLLGRLQFLSKEEIANLIGLKIDAATILFNAIQHHSANSMFDIRQLAGLGNSSIQKLYEYLSNERTFLAKDNMQINIPF